MRVAAHGEHARGEVRVLLQHDVADALHVVERADRVVARKAAGQGEDLGAVHVRWRHEMVARDDHPRGVADLRAEPLEVGLHAAGTTQSCIIARSTSQVTISPGRTRSRPEARAMIFSESVMGNCGAMLPL